MKAKQAINGTGLPLVSVIMPIRNEVEHVERCLDAVLAQDYPADCLDVVVLDGMSEDRTREIVSGYVQGYPNVRLLDNPQRIVSTALNIGIRAAKGDILIRVDGHTTIAPDYVRQCVAALGRTGADNVGGRMDAESSGLFGEAVALATSSPFGVGDARFHYSRKEEWADTVYMGAYRREVFDRVGLFDEEMVRDQDDEFNYRLRARGGRILLCPQIRSRYTNRSSPRKLWRQYFEYGYWKVRVLQKHPRQMSWRQFVPPMFVMALLGTLGLSAFGVFWPLASIAGSYLVANLAASLSIAVRSGLRHLAVLPVVFAILHVSWGMGFLSGLLRFANRWGDRGSSYVADTG
jgi:succinoglycan biosynthesis protein ExoA